MAEVHRNFRSTYLEKVGIKGVEEKKTLDIILNDKHVDLLKLKQFCQKFPLPAAYRLYVWKIVLGGCSFNIAQRYANRRRFVHNI